MHEFRRGDPRAGSCGAFLPLGCDAGLRGRRAGLAPPRAPQPENMVIDRELHRGRKSPGVAAGQVVKSDAEWRAQLSPCRIR